MTVNSICKINWESNFRQKMKPNLTRRQVLKLAAVGAMSGGGLSAFSVARADSNTVKIGYITSLSGVRGSFGEADLWNIGKLRSTVKKLTINGKNYKVDILLRDN